MTYQWWQQWHPYSNSVWNTSSFLVSEDLVGIVSFQAHEFRNKHYRLSQHSHRKPFFTDWGQRVCVAETPQDSTLCLTYTQTCTRLKVGQNYTAQSQDAELKFYVSFWFMASIQFWLSEETQGNILNVFSNHCSLSVTVGSLQGIRRGTVYKGVEWQDKGEWLQTWEQV